MLGGRGFMGRRILRLLPKNIDTVVAGRGPERDDYIRFDVHEPEGVKLREGDVVINTVGPFTYAPEPVVRACLDHGAHYVDLAETPAYMRGVREVARGATRRLAAITGCSSVPGLVEIYARRWAGREDVALVRAQLSIGTNNESSSTLLYSMLAPIGRERGQTLFLAGQKQGLSPSRWFSQTWLRKHEGLPARRYGLYPGGLEDGLKVGERVVPATFGFGFDRRSYTLALWLLAPLVGATPRALLRLGAKVGNALAPLARPLGTKIGIMSLDALDANGAAIGSVEIRATANGLDVPSWPSVWAAERLVGETDIPANCTSIADLIDPDDATRRLRASGFEVREVLDL